MIKNTGMVWFNMLMVIDTKVHGKMVSALIMEFMNTPTEIFTMDNGEMILSKDTES